MVILDSNNLSFGLAISGFIVTYLAYPPDNTLAEYGERLDKEYAALQELEDTLKKNKTMDEEVRMRELEKIGSRLTEINIILEHGDYQDAE